MSIYMTDVTDEEIETMFRTHGLMVNADPRDFNRNAVISLLNSYVIDSNGHIFSFDGFKDKLTKNEALSSSGLLKKSKFQKANKLEVLPDDKLERFYNWLVRESRKSTIAVVNQSGHGAALEARDIHKSNPKKQPPKKGGSHKTKIQYTRKYKRRPSRKNKSYKVRRT